MNQLQAKSIATHLNITKLNYLIIIFCWNDSVPSMGELSFRSNGTPNSTLSWAICWSM